MEKKTPRNGNDLGGQILGKWRLLEFLGEGATAHVYRAEHPTKKGWQRAIKVFFIQNFTEKEKQAALAKLELESLLCKDRIHDNVILVPEPPEENGPYLYYVMDYADGGSLRDFIKLHKQENHPIPIEQVVRWGVQIASGLSALHTHERHIIHRDICPANLLLSKNNILIADLGFAQVRDDLSRRSELGSVSPFCHPGHIDCMSPQQRNDPRPVKPSDDIFSAGCVMFELLTLMSYQGEDEKTLASHPKKYREDVPIWLDAIVAACLAEKREDRFQSAEELRQSLTQKRLVRQPAGEREKALPDIDDLSDLVGRIPHLTIANGVYLEVPEDLPAAAEKAWQECLEAFFMPQGSGGFLDWLKEDVIEALKKQRNLPARKKMEEMLARAESLHQSVGARDDLLARSQAFTDFLSEFPSFHMPVVAFTPKNGLDFGELGLCEAPQVRKLTIKNLGSSQLVYRVASNHPALLVGQQTVFSCQPGGSNSLDLAFQPDVDFPTSQPPKTLLQLDTNIGKVDIQVQYKILPPEMELTASQLIFDINTLKAPQELIISNPGRSPLIGNIVIKFPWLRLEPAESQFRCEPGGQYRVRLSLLPEKMPAKGDRVENALLLETSAGERTIPVTIPTQPVSLTLELAPGVGMEFVRVPAGEFLMGSDPNTEKQASQGKQPQHKIYLDEYLIGKTPVTNRQYQAFVEASGFQRPRHWKNGKIPEGKENHPVVYVNWQDAVAFCAWASRVSRQEVRLPAEAEWEKAARGADGRIHPWGDQVPDATYCNFSWNVNDTTPVGRYNPRGDSPYGAQDMAGNVWEWTNSLWGMNFEEPDFRYPFRAGDGREDPVAKGMRVLRGGSWNGNEHGVRSADRYRYDPDIRYNDIGFRCARSLPLFWTSGF